MSKNASFSELFKMAFGEVAEWSKAPVSKTGNRETGSRVQIPSSPQEFKTKF